MEELEKSKRIKEWSSQDQPREKMMSKGSTSLTDAELLAILINTGIPGKSALDLAKELLVFAQNNLAMLSKMNYLDIMNNLKGIGEAKAIKIAAALELGRRRRDSDDIEISLASPQQLFDYIMPLLADNPIEEFWVILANRKLSLIRSQMMFRGGIDAVSVDIRLIMKYALEHNASCIAIAHNHPSGQAKPSTHDKEITSRLKEACNFMSIQLLDHIIVASNKSYFSFADSGLIDW